MGGKQYMLGPSVRIRDTPWHPDYPVPPMDPFMNKVLLI